MQRSFNFFAQNAKNILIYYKNCVNIIIGYYVYLEKVNMKNVKYIIFGLIIAVSIALCFNDYDKAVDGGILADENAVSSARQEIIDKENSFLASEGDVFWTASGKSWHSTHKCTYLSEAKNVYHGTVDEAKLAGKEKGCSKCCNNYSDTSDSDAPNYTDDPIDAGDVFWRSVAHFGIKRATARI